MIHLSKAQLLELASAFVVANTPASLYQSLTTTTAFGRLRDECSLSELHAYWDQLTARAKRTEIVIALAYGVLISIVSRGDSRSVKIDTSRLTWGSIIEQITRLRNPPTRAQIITLHSGPKIEAKTIHVGGSLLIL